MAEITKEAILKTADVARLTITDEEATKYSAEISAILTYSEKINEINLDGVKPTTNGNKIVDVLRKDEAIQYITKEDALKNAPEHEDGQFKVPQIME